jgi:hypothetical protein
MQRTLGPFSGRHLTVIMVALIVAIFVPGTVWAVDTFSNVAIQDPVSGVKASVDPNHRVLVGDGNGALSVDGTVAARPTAPGTPWRTSEDVNGIKFIAGPGPTGAPINITSMTISLAADTTGEVILGAFNAPSSATSCAGASNAGTIWHVRDVSFHNPLAVAFPTPLQYRPPSGQRACLLVNGSDLMTVNASGFYGG